MANRAQHGTNGKLTDEDDTPVGTTAADLPGWAELGLEDPPRDGRLPERGQTADVLMHALTLPGALDPAEAIIDAVRRQHAALGVLFVSSARHLEAAMVLARRAVGRAPAPPPDEPMEPTSSPVSGS